MTKSKQLRKIIQDKLYPEGVKVEEGVIVQFLNDEYIFGGEDNRDYDETIILYEKNENGLPTGEKIVISGKRVEELKMLGKPTTLRELLLVLNAKTKKVDGMVYVLSSSGLLIREHISTTEPVADIDLTKTIENQDDEVIEKLIELVK